MRNAAFKSVFFAEDKCVCSIFVLMTLQYDYLRIVFVFPQCKDYWKAFTVFKAEKDQVVIQPHSSSLEQQPWERSNYIRAFGSKIEICMVLSCTVNTWLSVYWPPASWTIVHTISSSLHSPPYHSKPFPILKRKGSACSTIHITSIVNHSPTWKKLYSLPTDTA